MIMPDHAGPIAVRPDTEIAQLLDAAAAAPILLEKDGILYQLRTVEADDPWAAYDPERVRAALRASAGALKGIDREELWTDLKAQRAQDSHGRPA
ncbi:MAG: hypothetical protein ACR2PL_19935 [Dehalococcoidia bacterium]